MSANRHGIGNVIKVLALLGGIWILALATYASAVQLNVGEVFRGQIPVVVAFGFARDSLPVLVGLFLIGLLSIGLALVHEKIPVLAGLIWLIIAGVLFYGVYLARFSIGIFLFPAGLLILIGSFMILGGKVFGYY